MKTNNLQHKITCKDTDGNNMFISIRLNDECHNGHQDFAITADIYEKGKPHTDRYCFMGGCCHDEIIAAKPELKIFVNLHLCDYAGIPMYAVENGFYHLRNGFNNTKPEEPKFVEEFCSYYRVTEKQFNVLQQSENKLQYALNLQNLGILNQWKVEADKAIKLLEKFTGNEFICDSKKTQYNAPSRDEILQEEVKQIDGYYSPEAKQARENEKAEAIVQSIENERNEKIKAINLEFDTKRAVLAAGGEEGLENCIFYNHTKTLCFNWKSYDMISETKYNQIIETIVLSEGVLIKNDHGRK